MKVDIHPRIITKIRFYDFFTRNSNSSSYVLRKMATDLKLPKKKSCNGQRCFSYRGAKMWNDLPEKIKQASSLYCFKKNV